MPTHQKYSTRIHSKRQLGRANEHIQAASKVLCEISPRYVEALPRVSSACNQMIDMLNMVKTMIDDIRNNI